jgi:hypothetical protein
MPFRHAFPILISNVLLRKSKKARRDGNIRRHISLWFMLLLLLMFYWMKP